jgi:recombinational DNA repair protein (RecF pathway)
MLFADAKSVREERSRQRYALQDFSLVRVTLIRGKSGWRVGSIEALDNYYNAAHDKAARGSIVKLVRLLRRFVHGEEPHRQLFDYTKDALNVLRNDVSERSFLETVIQLELMRLLGYVDDRQLPADIVDTKPSKLISLGVFPVKNLDALLDKAVNASHL